MNKLILVTFTLLLTINAMAAGYGIYGNYNLGKAFFNDSMKPLSGTRDLNEKFITNSTGGGIIIEFASTEGKKIDFRYRFKAGAEALFAQRNNIRDMYRINFTNIFYFSIIKYKFLNVLFGPQIGANYLHGTASTIYTNFAIINFNGAISTPSTVTKDTITIKAGGINLGISLNFDFNIKDKAIIFIQLSGEQNIYFSKRTIRGWTYIINPPPEVPPLTGSGSTSSENKKILKDLSTEGSVCIGVIKKI